MPELYFEKGTTGDVFVVLFESLFGLRSEIVAEMILLFDELLDERTVALVFLGIGNNCRAGNNKRSPGFID